MKVVEVLAKSSEFLAKKGFDTSRLDTELLLAHALGWQRIDLYLKYDYPLSEKEESICRETIMRRSRGEPVAYIIGRQHFYGEYFFVQAGILIPRPETELLVEESLKWLAECRAQEPLIYDWGCGSGCVGLSIIKNSVLKNQPASLVGFDISSLAIEISQKNAISLGINNRCSFRQIDLDKKVAASAQKANVIVANPPYIAKEEKLDAFVKQYEPAEALFAENDGLAKIRTWAKSACWHLDRPGICLFEIGMQQAAAAQEIFQQLNFFTKVEVLYDLSGKDRVIKALS